MLIDINRTISFMCPHCSDIYTCLMSVFIFSGKSSIKLSCPHDGCHMVCGTVLQTKSRYKISVLCPYCGETHTFAVLKENFWKTKFMSLQCPETEMDVLFIGETERVVEAVREHTKLITETMKNAYENGFLSSSITDNILNILEVMLSEDDIHCRCGKQNIQISVDDKDTVIVSCDTCGRRTVIQPTEGNYEKLMNADALIIGKKL